MESVTKTEKAPVVARGQGIAGRLLSNYGMGLVLVALCTFFAWATYHPESPTGREGARSLSHDLAGLNPRPQRLWIVATGDAEGQEFAAALEESLRAAGLGSARTVIGDPPTVREALDQAARAGSAPDTVATMARCRDWGVWQSLRAQPAFAQLRVAAPVARYRSAFLSPNNLRNVADQISVIAIIAAGMTMVIVAGGIDLSVGSLVAVSAVVAAWIIQRMGGESAGGGVLLLACGAAILLCGAVGVFSGTMVTAFRIPPFIATLAMMQVAGGLAFIISQGQSIYAVPASFTWLGRGEYLGIPNDVLLMVSVYIAAYVTMTRTSFGRAIYAVGGNAEAARLSGVPISRIRILVYALSGLAAGVGGVITASQLRSGAATYGASYELYVIAAVVVGGTSLTGGEGHVFGTLIGALIIGVIRNGMNLMNVEPYTQKVMLGLVILGAVLLDMLKRRRMSSRRD